MDTELITVTDLAARLNCCRRTVYNFVKSGRGPAPFRLGGKMIRWRKEDVEEWIREQVGKVKEGPAEAA